MTTHEVRCQTGDKNTDGYVEDSIMPQPQSKFLKPGEIPKQAPKIFPENCIIDWNNDAVRIHNLIRGLAPYPGAKSFFRMVMTNSI